MVETNPLQPCYATTTSQKNKYFNKSGRPTNVKAIKFSPQPQSLISQLLKQLKEDDLVDSNVEHNQQLELISANDEVQPEYNDILCQVCSHRSSNMKQHRKHMKTHDVKQFTCDYLNCDYTCKLSSNMIKHKRIHTSERPFLCDQCTFRSNFINSLKVHKRIHTDERPYICSHCPYRCNSSSNLKKHVRHRHSLGDTK